MTLSKWVSKREIFSLATEVDRLDVTRSEIRRALVKLALSYKTTTIDLQRYQTTTQDWTMRRLKAVERNNKIYFVINEANTLKADF